MRASITLTMSLELDVQDLVHGQIKTGTIMLAVEKEMAKCNPEVKSLTSSVTESIVNLSQPQTKGAPNV